MPSFAYEARDAAGRRQAGHAEADSAAALAGDLRRRGWLVLRVEAAPKAAGGQRFRLNPFAWLPPRSLDVEVSFQQLAVMLRSGLSLLAALRTVAEQAQRPSMRRVWEAVSQRIQEGSDLAEALKQHRCFPHLCVQLVRIGEQTGNLETVLSRAADVLERRRTLITSVLTALAYPTVVLVASIGVAGYMVFGVIPKLAVFLNQLGRRLPAMTQLLVDLATTARAQALHVGIALLAAVLAGTLFYLWPPGRFLVDRWLLRVPVVGGIFRLAGTALLARSLGLLLASGVTLLDGLRTVESLFRNRYLAAKVSAARDAVMRGGTLADNLTDPTAFMPMLSRMVAVGESAGTLEEVLEENAQFHEQQLQRTIRWLSLLIEPAIIIVVGGVVGFVYISFFLALFAAGSGGR
ncbi:MAG: type II secretion system F family protein [Gemmataceae bacterium]|nr:type II secretion system F family protein [Gemmataceae bacterium]MDW8267417.1 type II secretion system F family protein [Gemmataceae bacterium]